MARDTTFRLKRNFTAGEVSALLYGRTDNKRFQNGCKTLLNMVVKPQGPAIRRSGTLFKWDLTSLLDAQFTSEAAAQLLTNYDDLSAWSTFGGGTISDTTEDPLGIFNDIEIGSGGATGDGVESNAFSVSASEEIYVEVYAYPGDSGGIRIRIKDFDNTVNGTVSGTFGNLSAITTTIGAITDISEIDCGHSVRIRFRVTCASASTDVRCVIGPNSAVASEVVDVLGAFVRRSAHAQYVERVSASISGLNPPKLIPFIVDEDNAYGMVFMENAYGTISILFTYNDAILADPDISSIPFIFDIWGTFDLPNIDYAQSSDVLIITQSGRQPLELSRTAVNEFAFSPISFTDPPADWTVGNGFPRKVNLYEQRSVFGSNGSRPQTLWFSNSGDFYDFSVSSPALDSEALTFTLDSGNQNIIRWMISQGPLLIGTLGEEWSLQGSGGTPLTPDNPKAEVEDSRGGEELKPIRVGPAVLFLERIGRTVNQFVYDFNIQGWAATDLSILAPHLLENNTLLDWSYQQTPNSVIWCIRDDGDLLGLTYQREHNVVGWHVHETQGEFISVGTVPGDSEDDLWVVVKRNINGTDKWYLERFEEEFIGGAVADSRFLDSHLVYDGASTDVITGLDHLEGESVSVLADGSVHPNVTVSGGQITLQREVTKAVVGLSYSSELVPTLRDIGQENDTSVARTYQIVRMYAQLYNSLGLKIQRIDNDEDSITEEEIPFRLPSDITGEPVPVFSGFKYIDFPEGWGRSVDMKLLQDHPLPMTVVSIVDELRVTN